MQTTHPSTEQLSYYMESPESSEHKAVWRHLMSCNQCRNRVDHLTQLERDIKHFTPRFTSHASLHEDREQLIERYVDRHLEDDEQSDIERSIRNDPQALKTALHYALNTAVMSKNIQTSPDNLKSTTTESQSTPATTGLLKRIKLSLQWPTPAWSIAPAALALAAIISYGLITLQGNLNPQGNSNIVAFQDNPQLSFQQPGMPAGSIGFFHDAQVSTKPFAGMQINSSYPRQLEFTWSPIADASDYTLEVYTYQQGESVRIAQQQSDQPGIILADIALVNNHHYQWKLTGQTQQGLRFQTQGDFIYVNNRN